MALDDLDNVWVSELIFAADAETQAIIDVTGDVEACLGSSPELLVGLPLFASVHRDDIASAQAAFDRSVSEGRATWEGRVQRADGAFVRYGWEGRLGLDGKTIYARSRDIDRVRAGIAEARVYERLADLTADLLIVVNNEGRVVKANQAAIAAHNVPADDFVGRRLVDFVTEEGVRTLNEIPGRLMRGESVIDFQVPALDGLGGQMIMEGTATFDSLTNRWYVVERDVTERVAREQELEITRRFFDLSASELILIDDEDRVVRANRSFLEIASVHLEDVVGRDILDALGVVAGADVRSLLGLARSGTVVEPAEICVRVGEARRTFEIHMSAASNGGSVYLGCRDVTEERSLQAEMVYRATHDSLTGLANRAALSEAIAGDLNNGEFVAIVMLDLDGFKKVNDSFGHAAGDALLVRIAERLEQRTRGVDLVARMGGDEFVILLRGVPDLATVEVVGEKIRRAFLEPFDVDGRSMEVMASVGGTAGDRSTHAADELLLEADLAAYSAKQAADGRCRVFDEELRSQADFSSAVEEHLQRVLSAQDFDLDIVERKDRNGELVGLGVIAPAVASAGERRWNQESLRVAKNLGLLGPISKRLTAEATKGLAPWLKQHPDCYLEIVYNLWEVSIAGFQSTLLETLTDSDVDPTQFVVSLADHGDVDARTIDLSVIAALRSSGVKVALSDSFADAHTLSIMAAIGLDRIDVDAAHVAATADGSVARLIVNTVLDIADRLGIVVMIDAGFTPDVVDVGQIFRDCAPLGVTSNVPIPIEDFLAGTVEEVNETTVDQESFG